MQESRSASEMDFVTLLRRQTDCVRFVKVAPGRKQGGLIRPTPIDMDVRKAERRAGKKGGEKEVEMTPVIAQKFESIWPQFPVVVVISTQVVTVCNFHRSYLPS